MSVDKYTNHPLPRASKGLRCHCLCSLGRSGREAGDIEQRRREDIKVLLLLLFLLGRGGGDGCVCRDGMMMMEYILRSRLFSL